jgi:hypothetical protein
MEDVKLYGCDVWKILKLFREVAVWCIDTRFVVRDRKYPDNFDRRERASIESGQVEGVRSRGRMSSQ